MGINSNFYIVTEQGNNNKDMAESINAVVYEHALKEHGQQNITPFFFSVTIDDNQRFPTTWLWGYQINDWTTTDIIPTSTPRIPPVQSRPTQPNSQPAVCSCSGDTMNCSNFSSQSSAQACFNYCMGQVGRDIHRLDNDEDQIACESL